MDAQTTVTPAQESRALAAVAAQFWVNGMVYAAVIPRLPDIRDRLSIGVSTLGVILTVSALGGLIGSAVGGPAIVRFGTKRSILIGTVVTLLILPTVGLTRSVVLLVISLGCLAAFDVVIDIAMNMQGSWLSARRTTPVMNRLHGLWSLGTVIGGLVAVRAASAGVSLSTHLLVVALLLAATLAVSGRHLLAVDAHEESDSADAPPAGANPQPSEPTDLSGPTDSSGAARPLARLRRSPLGYALLLGLLGGAAVTMEMTTSDWAAFRLADDLGADPGRVGLGFVAFTAGMVTGRFAGDAVQSLLGPRRLVGWATVLAATGLVVATALPTEVYQGVGLSPVVVSLIGFYVAALGVSVIFPQLYDAAAKAPGPKGRGLAALTAGTRVAGLLAPIVVGFVADTELSVGTAVALVTLPCCLITLVVRLSGDRATAAASVEQ